MKLSMRNPRHRAAVKLLTAQALIMDALEDESGEEFELAMVAGRIEATAIFVIDPPGVPTTDPLWQSALRLAESSVGRLIATDLAAPRRAPTSQKVSGSRRKAAHRP